MQIGHQHRRGQALSSKIGYGQPKSITVEWKDIEIVSADDARGLPRARDFVSGELRDLFGQKSFLNPAGFRNFVLLLVKLRSAYLVRLRFLHGKARRLPPLPPQRDLLAQDFQPLP